MKNILLATLAALMVVTFNEEVYAQKKLERNEFSVISSEIHKYIAPLARIAGFPQIESVIELPGKTLEITFSINLSDYPLREDVVDGIYNIAKDNLPEQYKSYKLILKSNRSTLEELASKFYSSKNQRRGGKQSEPHNKLVSNISFPFKVTNGLQNNYIAMWQSHGYYYNQNDARWQWQRATLFQTVEDLYTQGYVLPFLVPMLEKAGATVLLPRERDYQIYEVIVDGDSANSGYFEISKDQDWKNTSLPGFANPKNNYETGENPFTMGYARSINTIHASENADPKNNSSISIAAWRPEIPQSGEYAVYVSYQTLPNSSEDAQYIVYHKGGETRFKVNQKMGGSTWIYLGTFSFDKGSNSDQYVTLLNTTSGRGGQSVVVADAVKFGGGMGNIARNPSPEMVPNRKSTSTDPIIVSAPKFELKPEVSGYPRFTEGSRYWLQWAGFADTVYTPNKNMNDYNDDYMSRGLWVNAMSGGSKFNPKGKGYNIPIDLSLAFHTDAGTTLNDSIIGTLSIYTRFSYREDKFPDGRARITSRELADIVQTQIVEDIKQLFEPDWSRRGLWDRTYAESRSPNVPSMLLELLSHQNMADMRYGLDPMFRFHVSRAIYKGLLRYLSFTNNFECVIQPLPVTSFSAVLSEEIKQGAKPRVTLSWHGVHDPLEPTATPEKYILYTSVYDPSTETEHIAFDNGVVIDNESVTLSLEYGKIYSYKVAALNSGGESFPSEVLSVGFNTPSAKTVLVVNGFDRVSAPFSYTSPDSTKAGFESYIDAGVPYGTDISFIGSQYEFRRDIPWMFDNRPGFGASHRDYEARTVAGNTFDYPFSHGISIMKKGYNFVSSGREALISGDVNMKKYPITDIIMGKQVKMLMARGANDPKFEVFPLPLQNLIREYCQNGGNIIVSGAYIGSDLWDTFYYREKEKTISDDMNVFVRDMNRAQFRVMNVLSSLKEREKELSNTHGNEWFSSEETAMLSSIESQMSLYTNLLDSLRSLSSQTGKMVSEYESTTDPQERGRIFAREVLKYSWMTYMASATGQLKSIQNPFGFSGEYSFDNKPNEKIYCVESPDGLLPIGNNAWSIYRYKDTNISAGVAYDGKDYKSVSLGFPIETLKSREQIDKIISDILDFFENGTK